MILAQTDCHSLPSSALSCLGLSLPSQLLLHSRSPLDSAWVPHFHSMTWKLSKGTKLRKLEFLISHLFSPAAVCWRLEWRRSNSGHGEITWRVLAKFQMGLSGLYMRDRKRWRSVRYGFSLVKRRHLAQDLGRIMR